MNDELERARRFGGRVDMRRVGPLTLDGVMFQGAGRSTVLDFRGVNPSLVRANTHACVLLRNGASLRDCTVIGLSDYGAPTPPTATVRTLDSDGSYLANVHASGGRHTNISIRGGRDIVVDNCTAFDENGDDGLAYGLSLEGSHNVTVTGGAYHGRRHGIAAGNKPETGEEIGVSRFAERCTIIGARISSNTLYAADFHPGTRHNLYQRCHIEGGLNLAGYRNAVNGGTITPAPSGECVHLHSLETLDIEINGVHMKGDPGDRALIWYDRTPVDSVHPSGGILRIIGCSIESTNDTGEPIYLRNRFVGNFSALLAGNTIRSVAPVRFRRWASHQDYGGLDYPAADLWSRVVTRNNGFAVPIDIPAKIVTAIDSTGDFTLG